MHAALRHSLPPSHHTSTNNANDVHTWRRMRRNPPNNKPKLQCTVASNITWYDGREGELANEQARRQGRARITVRKGNNALGKINTSKRPYKQTRGHRRRSKKVHTHIVKPRTHPHRHARNTHVCAVALGSGKPTRAWNCSTAGTLR